MIASLARILSIAPQRVIGIHEWIVNVSLSMTASELRVLTQQVDVEATFR